MAAMSDYLENKLIDFVLRGQTFTPASTLYLALFTAAPSDSGGGTEVSGGSYARVAITSNMTNWSGTQGDGTTVASSGTGGVTKNNATLTFPAPTANWNTVTHYGLFDAPTGGNLYFHGALTASQTINSGAQAPVVDPNTLTFTWA